MFSDLNSFDQLGVSAVASLSQINSDVGVISNGSHYWLAIFLEVPADCERKCLEEV